MTPDAYHVERLADGWLRVGITWPVPSDLSGFRTPNSMGFSLAFPGSTVGSVLYVDNLQTWERSQAMHSAPPSWNVPRAADLMALQFADGALTVNGVVGDRTSTGRPFDAINNTATDILLQTIDFLPEGAEPPPAFVAPAVNPGEEQGAYVARCVAANPDVPNATARCTLVWIAAQEPEPPPGEELQFPPGEYVGQIYGPHNKWTWNGYKWVSSFNWRATGGHNG